MLKLLTCAGGHFWETADEVAPTCPECGAPAESLPLLDLVASEPPAAPAPKPELALLDDEGRPVVAGFEISEELGLSPTRVRRYRAKQLGIGRDVLLEVVLAREDAGQVAWGSLRGEASALGKLAHPNVVQIHDTGERDRQIFYNAVELIDGPALPQKVADRPLTVGQILRLVELLARAVDHAHAGGNLHRNLRPACVLLHPLEMPKGTSEKDDPAGAACALHGGWYVPKLTGFGVARRAVEGEAIDADLYGDELGYLSPEQAWGRARDYAPHTDVYGLGGVLYFLLTGRPPFRGPSYADTLDAIQTAPLRPPADRPTPAGVQAVCRKALARNPRRRYASAAEFADELRRLRQGRSPLVQPASAAQQIGGWIGRRPVTFVAGLLLLVASLSGLVALLDARGEEQATASREAQLRRELLQANASLTQANAWARKVGQAQEFLGYRQKIDQVVRLLALKDANGARRILADLPERWRGFEWHYLTGLCAGTGGTEVAVGEDLTAMALADDGRRLATGGVSPGRGGVPIVRVRVWNAVTGVELRSWQDDLARPAGLAFGPGGKELAVAGSRLARNERGINQWRGELRVFDAERGDAILEPDLPQTRVTDVAFLRDRILVARGTGEVTAVAPQGKQRGSLPALGRSLGWDDGVRITRVAVGARGEHAAVRTSGAGDVRVHDVASGRVVRTLAGATATALALGEPGGGETHVAVARDDRSVVVTELVSNGEAKLTDLPDMPARLAFSADAQRLAAALPDGRVIVWGQAGGLWVELLTLQGPGTAGLAFGGVGLAAAGGRKAVVWGTAQ